MKFILLALTLFQFTSHSQTHTSGPPRIASFPKNKKCEVMIKGAKDLEAALINDFKSEEKSIGGLLKELSVKLSLESLDELDKSAPQKSKCACEFEKKNVKKLKELFSYYLTNVHELDSASCPEAKKRKDLMDMLATIIYELEK